MVSEVIMYQSMFVLGILMFGFFAITFSDYQDFADETTLASNLEQVANEIGQEITKLIQRGRAQQSGVSNFTITLDIVLDSQFSGTSYTLQFASDPSGTTNITASTSGKVYANYSLGFVNGTADGQIDFQGVLSSSSGSPKITYTWDSELVTGKEAIIFS